MSTIWRSAPSPTLFRHFIEEAEGQAGSIYGRKMYEIMRYWDDEHPEWGADERAFALGVAQAAEMGRLALAKVGRSQRHAASRMIWKAGSAR